MNKRKNKLQLLVGDEFESIKTEWGNSNNITADVINAASNAHENRAKIYLAYGIVVGMFIFVVGAAILGLVTGTFIGLQYVWGIVGPFFGMICSYYFRTSGGQNEPDKQN